MRHNLKQQIIEDETVTCCQSISVSSSWMSMIKTDIRNMPQIVTVDQFIIIDVQLSDTHRQTDRQTDRAVLTWTRRATHVRRVHISYTRRRSWIYAAVGAP